MRAVVLAARERFGPLHGVVHAAGVSAGGSVLTTGAEAFLDQVAAKVDGTLVLDEVLAEEALDFVCYFSSSSAILGDFGACDYAVGNRFQTAYARHRTDLARDGERSGTTVAVNWPLWREGGMGFDDDQSAELYLSASGQRALERAEGIALFEQLLGQPAAQHLVLVGEPDRVHRMLGITGEEPAPVETADVPARLLTDLKAMIGDTLSLPAERVHADESLTDLGFDSISLARFASAIGTRFPFEVLPPVFFVHPTIEKIAAHLLAEHGDAIRATYDATAPVAVRQVAAPVPVAAPARAVERHDGPEPIAIVGMSGRFPAARTVDGLWDILVEGRDALTPVPADRRADWSEADAAEADAARCGFVPGIAEFDPAFFEISPREARTMDPRQRLLLQEAWRALEDAGYGARKLRDERIGMFVGAEQGDYLRLTGGEGTITAQHEGILAARLAYFLDFSGPVLAVNTACSSGLVAVHQACASLRTGECDAAVVAGVNLNSTARVYLDTRHAGMLSESGTCRAFDKRADGMVLGEAIAVVVLKPLSRAQADGDQVLAVIRGSGMNFDGKTNGITAPNGAAQSALYRDVYQRHAIDPRRIEHVVAHGTGTRLGDPVEVNGLTEVFGEHTADTGFCALTSTKSTFGHTMAASGVVSLIALTQSLRHGVIPASPHCEQESDYTDWSRSAFYVNKQTRPWRGDATDRRLGAVSAFGMSGTNVHLVVESAPAPTRPRPDAAPAYLLALSAKTADALLDRVRDLREVLQKSDADSPRLTDVSFTLLEGRQHFAHRCALVVGSREEAVSALSVAETGRTGPAIHRGEVPRELPDRARLDARADALATSSADHRDVLLELADLYCQGAAWQWREVFPQGEPRQVALPGYPFSRKEHWITTPHVTQAVPAPAGPVSPSAPSESPAAAPMATDATTPSPVPAASNPTPVSPARVAGPDRVSARLPEPVGERAKVVLAGPDTVAAATAPATGRPTNVVLAALANEPAPTPVTTPVTTPTVAVVATDVLRRELLTSLAEALYLPEEEIDQRRTFIELGLDSIVGVEWVKAINKRYGTALTATKLYDRPTLREFAQFLREELAAAAPATPPPAPVVAAPVPPAPVVAPRFTRAELIGQVRDSLATALFLEPADVDVRRSFVELGLDSIIGVEWIKVLNKAYGTTLAATRLYDYASVTGLAEHLAEHFQATAAVPLSMPTAVPDATPLPTAAPEVTPEPAATPPVAVAQHVVAPQPIPAPGPAADGVAVIGMSGRYPDAADLDRYWDNLRAGRDSVREIPPSRWDVERYYDARPQRKGKTTGKWLGLLDDADCFDPLFFNISPAEAEGLDPQQRLFLEEAYKAFEDAGYDPQSLSTKRCGVYLGISGSEYSFLVHNAGGEVNGATSGSNAIAAARIAYFLNLKGPALAIDTACSSSLVALHLARQALLAGEIDLALVGGVSLYLLPDTFVGMSEAGMLSPEGKCKTFDNSADGFVPGEGVGALVLKRLPDAETDRDHIHGVVAATGTNQDGKTNGITAPSATSQIDLLRAVYDDHGIDPATVGYVETHGTGTKLGDPIELDALSTVYRERSVPTGSCAIGSVKSNIGHTSAAAGVAGVQKALLGLRHRLLVPSLHFDTPNEHFDFTASPLRVSTSVEAWEPRGGHPVRRAAVSSFGFSGTNAHVVVDEYRTTRPSAPRAESAVIVLSAKTTEQLRDAARNLLDFLEREPHTALADLALTLQVGREVMDHRLAFVANSVAGVVTGLRDHLSGGDAVRTGRVPGGPVSWAEETEDRKARVRALIAAGDHRAVAAAWVEGYAVDWRAVHPAPQPHRISLPTYPFARERYWVESTPQAERTAVLHPMLHRNTSDFAGQRYSSTYTGDEPFLRDHRVAGETILPGVAYLELGLVAAMLATGRDSAPGAVLSDVVWTRPLAVGAEPAEVTVLPRPVGDAVRFEVHTGAGVTHGEGVVAFDAAGSAPDVDLDRLRTACRERRVEGAELYAAFGSAGIEYGATYRGVDHLLVGDGEVLARLATPVADGCLLSPGVLDAALQSVLGMMLADTDAAGRTVLPFAADRVRVFELPATAAWVWVRSAAGAQPGGAVRRFDLDVCDAAGRVLVRVESFSVRATSPVESDVDHVLAVPVWRERPLTAATGAPRRTVVFAEQGTARGDVRVLTSAARSLDGRYGDYAAQLFTEVKALLAEPDHTDVLVRVVLPDTPHGRVLSGLGALLTSAALENPRLTGQVVLVDEHADAREHGQDAVVRYRDGRREVLTWVETDSVEHPATPWRAGGVYLITGGLGGLGRIFAEEIAAHAQNATIVLTGRSEETPDARRFLDRLRATGARASYARVDVTDADAVLALVADTVRRSGGLHGVLHSAGVLQDGFLLAKTAAQFATVLAPKVSGLVNLDAATQGVDLDFFAAFSSGAAVAGNVGQTDYATANAFLDAFAAHRQELVAAGERRGRTISVNWPLWAEGGMHLDAAGAAGLRDRFGIALLGRAAGIEAFARSLHTGHSQVLVAAGDAVRIREALDTQHGNEGTPPVSAQVPAAPTGVAHSEFEDRAVAHLTTLLAGVLKMPARRIEPDVALEQYGINSVVALGMTTELETVFGPLPKTLFFEYQTIRAVTGYFATAHGARLRELLGEPATRRGRSERRCHDRGDRRPGRHRAGARRPRVRRHRDHRCRRALPAGAHPGGVLAQPRRGPRQRHRGPERPVGPQRVLRRGQVRAWQDLPQVGWLPRRCRRVRPALLRHLPARGGVHRPAGAAVPRMRPRDPGGRGLHPAGAQHPAVQRSLGQRRRVRRVDVRRVPALRRHRGRAGPRSGAAGQRGEHRQPGVVLLRVAGPQRDAQDDVLVVADRAAPGLPEPAAG